MLSGMLILLCPARCYAEPVMLTQYSAYHRLMVKTIVFRGAEPGLYPLAQRRRGEPTARACSSARISLAGVPVPA